MLRQVLAPAEYADGRTPVLFLDPPDRTLYKMQKPISLTFPVPGLALSRRDCLVASLGAAAASTFPARGQSHVRNVSWLAEVQSPSMEGQTPLSSALKREDGTLVRSLDAWRQRRDEIRRSWLDYLGPLPQNPNPPRLKFITEKPASNGTGPIQSPPGVIRELVEYESEPGLRVRGYLIKPKKLSGKAPGIVVLHATTHNTIRQSAGVEGKNQLALGLKLAQQGFVTFSPACFLWEAVASGNLPSSCQEQHSGNQADAHGFKPPSSWVRHAWEVRVHQFQVRHPNSTGMAKMLFDAQRGLDVLEQVEEVDNDRLGAFGHSLGAKESFYLSAFDERVRAAISSEPGIGAHFSNWYASWYLGPGIKQFGHDHQEVMALIAPRPFLLLAGEGTDGVKSSPFIHAAMPAYRLYGDPTRLGLLNHGHGHSVPPSVELRINEWFKTYL